VLSFAFSQEQEDFRIQLRRFAVAELAPRYNERAARPEFSWEAHRQLAGLGVLGIASRGSTAAPGRRTPSPWASPPRPWRTAMSTSPPLRAVRPGGRAARRERPGRGRRALAARAESPATPSRRSPSPSRPADPTSQACVRRRARCPAAGGSAREDRDHPRHGGCGRPGLRPRARIGRLPGHQLLRRSARPRGRRPPAHAGMGALPLCWGQLSFDDVFVPEDHLVGEPGRGFAAAMEHFDFSRPALRPALPRRRAGEHR